MPQDFIDCVNSGGKVVTETLKGNKYRHVCYDKKGAHYGETKTRKKKVKANDKKIEDSKILVADLRRLKEYFDEKRI